MTSYGEFPGGPVVKTWAFTAVDPGLILGWGTKIAQVTAVRPKKPKKLTTCNAVYEGDTGGNAYLPDFPRWPHEILYNSPSFLLSFASHL